MSVIKASHKYKSYTTRTFTLRKIIDSSRCSDRIFSIYSDNTEEYALLDDGTNFNLRLSLNEARKYAKDLLNKGFTWI
jgi:hypothetical protein